MNIGDKVILANTKEKGIVICFLKGDQVEVALDGWNSKQVFTKNELRLVDQPTENKPVMTAKPKNDFEKGIFLAFVPNKMHSGDNLELYVINNTDWDLPFSITIDKTRTKAGLMAGFIKSGGFQKHCEKLKIENFDEWKTISFSTLYFSETNAEIVTPLFVQKKFYADTFFQNKKIAPILDIEAYLFQIDLKSIEINAKEIQEKMLSQSAKIEIPIEKPPSELDLHIENISKNHRQLGKAEIFAVQLDAFEKHLDKAIASGCNEVLYIHGIGDWKLKKAIHEVLEFHQNVIDFGIANEQKYGMGATFVKIK